MGFEWGSNGVRFELGNIVSRANRLVDAIKTDSDDVTSKGAGGSSLRKARE
jgi:hypothetical protein